MADSTEHTTPAKGFWEELFFFVEKKVPTAKALRQDAANAVTWLIVAWLIAAWLAFDFDFRVIPGIIYAVGFFVIMYLAADFRALIGSALAGFGVRSAQQTDEESPDRSKGMLEGLGVYFNVIILGVQIVWGYMMLSLVFFNHDAPMAYFALILVLNFAWMWPIWVKNRLVKTTLYVITFGVVVWAVPQVVLDPTETETWSRYVDGEYYHAGMPKFVATPDGIDVEHEIGLLTCYPGTQLDAEGELVLGGFETSKPECYSTTTGERLVPYHPEGGGGLWRKVHTRPVLASTPVAPAAAVPAREYCDNDIGPIDDDLTTCWLKAGDEIKLSVSYAHCPYSVSGVEFFDHDGFGNWHARLEEGPREFEVEIGSLAAGSSLTIRGETINCPAMPTE